MRFFLMVFCFLNCFLLDAQSRKERETKAYYEINQLKRGALLIRLATKRNKIDALRKAGYTKKAEAIEEEQKNLNLELITAFRNEYTFSDLHFFYSNFTSDILSGNYENTFLDDSLNPISVDLTSDTFFIGEYGFVEADTNTYSSQPYYDANEKRMKEVKYGDTRLGISAFVVRDKNLYQLRDPFPFFVKRKKGWYKELKPAVVARIFNNRLKLAHIRLKHLLE
ncbi:MAG: hypothetical protein MRY83_02730 [Flavobacteriales bacterium]|nr:hypothetical protein [Flavobacteriales bacterium]